jgi:hypothetical protein
MKLKTSELIGDALLWAVATCEGYTNLHKIKGQGRWPHEPQLAMMPPRREYGAMELWEIGSDSDWEFFGPIIEREWVSVEKRDNELHWSATLRFANGNRTRERGPTALIAAMRCYVASKLGDEVEIPEELKC